MRHTGCRWRGAATTAWRIGLVGLGILVGVAVGGCSNGVSGRVRSATYPPDFHYITREKLTSTMWQLADLVTRLDHTLRDAQESDTARRGQAIQILQSMEAASQALGQGGWPSNHPRVSRNIESFRESVRAAKRDLELDPPSYFRAGSISGACLHCHQAP